MLTWSRVAGIWACVNLTCLAFIGDSSQVLVDVTGLQAAADVSGGETIDCWWDTPNECDGHPADCDGSPGVCDEEEVNNKTVYICHNENEEKYVDGSWKEAYPTCVEDPEGVPERDTITHSFPCYQVWTCPSTCHHVTTKGFICDNGSDVENAGIHDNACIVWNFNDCL